MFKINTRENILQPVVVKYVPLAQSGKLGKLGEGACKWKILEKNQTIFPTKDVKYIPLHFPKV